MSGRRRAVAFGVVSLSFAAMLVAACGLDIIGTLTTAPADSGIRPEAALPNLGDGFIDEDVRTLDQCGAVVGRGPSMVPVKNDAGFCIDTTEVTVGQYREFLRDVVNGAVIDAGAQCVARTADGYSPKQPASGPDDSPVTWVDWCDAVTFCAWTQKHICSGAADGGEWISACGDSKPDAAASPQCHFSAEPPSLPPVPYADGGCVAENAAAFDMIGNAAEWTSECVGGTCTTRGGYYSSGAGTNCMTATQTNALLGDLTVGFRCCR